MKILIFTVFLFFLHSIQGQEKSVVKDSLPVLKDSLVSAPKLIVGAYLDVYYGYVSLPNKVNEVPYFVSMHRHNEFAVNLAFADVKYNSEHVRARFAPAIGSYMTANYAAENPGFRNVLEADIGLLIWPKRKLWLDVGVLPSPYTNETAISKDHLMYSRSLAPEYVPYYLCGAKLTVPITPKLNAYFYLLNGWQQIMDQNQSKSVGTQLEYKPDAKNLINWNTYYGNERSASQLSFRYRYFSDIYWTYNFSGKWSFSSCLYAGLQEIDGTKTLDNYWVQANFLARWRFTPRSSLALRLEYFKDNKGVMMQSLNPEWQGFQSLGYGLCYTLICSDEVQFRLEARVLQSDRTYFSSEKYVSNGLFWGLSSLVFYLNN